MSLVKIKAGDWKSVERAMNALASDTKLGTTATATFGGLIVNGTAILSGAVIDSAGIVSATISSLVAVSATVGSLGATSATVSSLSFLSADGTNASISTLVTDQFSVVDCLSATPGELNVEQKLVLADTTTSVLGVVYKNTYPFLHNFHHPTGGAVAVLGRNTFVGEDSGNFIMGQASVRERDGSHTTGVGYHTLMNQTEGYRNTALGSDCMVALITGYNNVGIGWESLLGVVNGGNNTALGVQTLESCISGVLNLAMGSFALNKTTGDNNVAVGHTGLFLNTTGSGNIAIGANAGRKQTTADNQLFIDNTERTNAAEDLTEALVYGVMAAAPTNQTIRFNVGEAQVASGAPTIVVHNRTHEDTDGGRESRLNFKGEQSGGEETTLARVEVSHDGAVDDQKGKYKLYTNTGTDADTPTLALTIDSAQAATIVGGFGCNGSAAQTVYTVNAACTDLATVVALTNQMRLALIANGICV